MRIIREVMQGDPMLTFFPSRPKIRPAFRALSEKLGVSEGTVRERFQKLSGFLAGITLDANPVLFHERIGGLDVQVSDAAPKDEVLEKILLVQGVFQITDHHGSRAGVVFLFPDDPTFRRTTELILRIAGSHEGVATELPLPACTVRPSRLDYRILLSRQEGITKSNQTIGRELGVSSRTVKRRFTKLVSGGAILPHFLINVEALEGCVYAKLHVTCTEPAYRKEMEAAIVSMLDEFIFFTGRHVDLTVFNMILPGIPRARTILAQVRRIHGVKSARISFVERILDSPEVSREKVRHQLSLMSAPGLAQ